MKPKVLLIDIETSPIKAYTWGPKWETNLIEVIQQSKILSFSAKWVGGKHITKGLPNYKGYKKGVINDRAICLEMHDLLDQADIVVAHNGKAFDVKTINLRFLANGLGPTSPHKVVDTKLEFKKRFRAPSNSMDDICDYLGLGRKMEHEGFPLWKRCEAGHRPSWEKMLKYNKHDVVLLEALYLKIRPWIIHHPNIAYLTEKRDACPNCGSNKSQHRGWNRTKTLKFRRLQCECGSWHQASKGERY